MRILAYDPYNIKAVLTLAYMQSLFFGEMTDVTFNTLGSLKTNNPEYLSKIEYAKLKKQVPILCVTS